jgi:Flp pilus assembly pilin Flp
VLKHLIVFASDERGQDLVEYTLLIGFICLAGAATVVSMGSITGGLWSAVNARMAASNQVS